MIASRHAALRAALALLAAASGAACDVSETDCSEDRCVSAQSRDEVLAALEGHGDPVAEYLRGAVTARGTLTGDYRDILEGVGAITGCAPETQRTFVVLSNVESTPRPVHARCATDPVEASRFLMVMAGATPEPDIDPRVIHMVGWDDAAGEYRRYATFPDDSGEMALNVSPGFCFGCHGGPHRLDRWQPMMNVMTSPWSGWNAEPGFASHLFDEYLANGYRHAPVFSAMADGADSASNLEPIVRAGIDRVTASRLEGRSAAADLDRALELLRPVFCDEMVNSVSEVHDSGELRASAVVDDALRALYSRLGLDASWPWMGSPSIHLDPPGAGETHLDLFPVRGESSIQLELGLAARGVLSAQQLLRARAIDWQRPAASDARCDLYTGGRERILAMAWDVAGKTDADLAPKLFDEIMSEYPVPPGSDLIAIADARQPDARAAMTFSELGAAIEAHVEAVRTQGRSALTERRRETACGAAALYPFFPLAADLDCD